MKEETWDVFFEESQNPYLKNGTIVALKKCSESAEMQERLLIYKVLHGFQISAKINKKVSKLNGVLILCNFMKKYLYCRLGTVNNRIDKKEHLFFFVCYYSTANENGGLHICKK